LLRISIPDDYFEAKLSLKGLLTYTKSQRFLGLLLRLPVFGIAQFIMPIFFGVRMTDNPPKLTKWYNFILQESDEAKNSYSEVWNAPEMVGQWTLGQTRHEACHCWKTGQSHK
jgi:hypothetical protein